MKPVLRSYFLVIAALVLAGCALERNESGTMVTVLNPAIPNKMVERVPLVPRLDTLAGKTIYLVDIQWGGPDAAYSVFEEMQAWFSRNMPEVKTVLRRTSSSMFADDPSLRKELIDKKADAAIIGIAG